MQGSQLKGGKKIGGGGGGSKGGGGRSGGRSDGAGDGTQSSDGGVIGGGCRRGNEGEINRKAKRRKKRGGFLTRNAEGGATVRPHVDHVPNLQRGQSIPTYLKYNMIQWLNFTLVSLFCKFIVLEACYFNIQNIF